MYRCKASGFESNNSGRDFAKGLAGFGRVSHPASPASEISEVQHHKIHIFVGCISFQVRFLGTLGFLVGFLA